MADAFFDQEEVSKLMRTIFDFYLSEQNFVAVIQEDETLTVRFTSLEGVDTARFRSQAVRVSSGETITMTIAYEEGPAIGTLIGHLENDPPFPIAATNTVAGGDQCRNAQAPTYYGTISFFCTEISVEVRGPYGNKKCTQANAIVSNNHVIGRSDAGAAGEIINGQTITDIARLSCTMPFKLQGNVDISLGVITDLTKTQNWHVRDIGPLAGIRRPAKEGIRKYGARTGFTSGAVTGTANIKIGQYNYFRVFVTTGGFGCPGDSGSTVVAANNDVLGIFSWADIVPCDQNPKGYFFTLIKPGTLAPEETDFEIIIEDAGKKS